MNEKNEWVHLFQIAKTAQHKRGYTLYELTSMVYPTYNPDCITKTIVWKRYTDFKTLHKEIRAKRKILRINDKLPNLQRGSFFKRFKEGEIEERRKAILAFLDYVAKNPLLYTCSVFVKFFESSQEYIPEDADDLNRIWADHLSITSSDIVSNQSTDDEPKNVKSKPYESELLKRSKLSSQSPEAFAPSQNSPKIPNPNDRVDSPRPLQNGQLTESQSDVLNSKISRLNTSNHEKSTSLIDILQDFSLPLKPDKLRVRELKYLYDAAECVYTGQKHEIVKEYELALESYKKGVAFMINGVQNDRDAERRQLVKYKISKYILRSEKICNVFLAAKNGACSNNFGKKLIDSVRIERPEVELRGLTVKEMVGALMVVDVDGEEFIVKPIKKVTEVKDIELLLLPTNVPFMVNLVKYYNTKYFIYAQLEYIKTGLLWDYLKATYAAVDDEDLNTNQNDSIEFIDADNPSPKINEQINNTQFNEITNCENTTESNDGEFIDERIMTDNTHHFRNFETIDVLEATEVDSKSIFEPGDSDDSLDLDDLKSFEVVAEECMPEAPEDPRMCGISNESGYFTVENDDVCWSDSIAKMWDVQKVGEDLLVKWAAQLLIGIESLHLFGIICYDLQPKNILLDDQNNVKLTFFHRWENVEPPRFPQHVTSMYTAPELDSIFPVTSSADLWTYGVLMFELFSGLNFSECHPGQLFQHSIKVPKYVSREARDLIGKLLCIRAEKRLGYANISEIKRHPLFSRIDWDRLPIR